MRGNRTKNKTDGRYRQKRSDTKVKNIEYEYGITLGFPAEMTLGTLRNLTGKSFSQIIENARS